MKKLIILLFCFFATNAFALDNNTYYKVNHVYSWVNGEAHIWLENGGEHVCSDQTYVRRYLMSRATATEFDQKFSLLLAAKTSGQPVKLKYTCDSSNRPFIDAIRF